MSKIRDIYLGLCMCGVFRSLLSTPLFVSLSRCVAKDAEKEERISAYGAMMAEVYRQGGSLTDTVMRAVLEDENVYVKARARNDAVPREIQEAAEYELSVLRQLASLTPEDFKSELEVDYVLPFRSDCRDFCAEYEKRIQNIDKHGYGIFASAAMFRLDDNGLLLPIASPDRTTLDSFIGYESERQAVIDNTLSFISGGPAANVLLYGDAGTGKSSTVKAVVNEFFDRGLRLIELRKDQLCLLGEVMGRISDNPLKFIIFVDDLSFSNNDDSFSMLKAALEGSASARADNALIYATSNRRHIVRETLDDREGEDVHINDTMQEKLSLSQRFGLTVLFMKPDKSLYLRIVEQLAERYGIDMDLQSLAVRAEEYALRRGNRSARCAEQFVKSLL